MAICYDRHYPEYMRALALNGADLVFVPQAGAVGEWPDGMYEGEIRVAALHNGYYVALCNRVGQEDCLNFSGESFVCDPDGLVLARAPLGQDHILVADVDLAARAIAPAQIEVRIEDGVLAGGPRAMTSPSASQTNDSPAKSRQSSLPTRLHSAVK